MSNASGGMLRTGGSEPDREPSVARLAAVDRATIDCWSPRNLSVATARLRGAERISPTEGVRRS